MSLETTVNALRNGLVAILDGIRSDLGVRAIIPYSPDFSEERLPSLSVGVVRISSTRLTSASRVLRVEFRIRYLSSSVSKSHIEEWLTKVTDTIVKAIEEDPSAGSAAASIDWPVETERISIALPGAQKFLHGVEIAVRYTTRQLEI